MSRVVSWTNHSPKECFDMKYKVMMDVVTRGSCEYEYLEKPREEWDEDHIKRMDVFVKQIIVLKVIEAIPNRVSEGMEDIIRSMNSKELEEEIKQSAERGGYKIISYEITPYLTEQSQKWLDEAKRKAEEFAKKMAAYEKEARERAEKSATEATQPQKQEPVKPKQLTPEELASLPTSSSPLDSVKEKVGKIFGFFSK